MRLPKLRLEKNKRLLTVHPTQRASGAKRRQTRGCWRRSASCQTPTRTGALSMSSRLLCSGAGETASRGKFLHQPPSAAASFSALTGVLTHNFCCSPRALLAERMEGGILTRSSIAQPTTASGPALRVNPGMSSPQSSALTHQTLQC